MNNQFMQAVQQIKSMGNPQQMAMNALNQSARQGNPMAKNILERINSGDTSGAEQMLSNIMNEQGMSIDDVRGFMK